MQTYMPEAGVEVHLHPFLGNYRVVDIVQAMRRRNLSAIALEILDDEINDRVAKEARQFYPNMLEDEYGMRLATGEVLFRGREYSTAEGFHILTVGYSDRTATKDTEIRRIIDAGLEHNAFVLLDHIFVDNVYTRTAGHIDGRLEEEVENLCREYSGKIALEWNGYCVPWMRKVLQEIVRVGSIVKPEFKGRGEYHDVNKKSIELSQRLIEEGYNVPIIADTDLHARSKHLLDAMGTARFTVDLRGESPEEILASMKGEIFAGRHKNQFEYVSMWHMLEAFCFPILFPKLFPKPRS